MTTSDRLPDVERRKKDKGRSDPERRCIASGELFPQSMLLKFVIGPDGFVVPDHTGKLPGRGIWLSPSRDMLEKACKKNLFARSAKAQVKVPEDLVGQLETQLTKRCLDALGLAKRAGHLVAGFEKTRAWLSEQKVGLLVQAADAAEDGRGKVRALAKAVNPDLPIDESFTAQQLGQALGRESWVHIALRPGGIADTFVADAARLSAVRGIAGQPAKK
ncbi:RNA-binding protein [Kiloniella laminariae]|uniref:RNA-binding protein n=1 Tax=Kiloniella laminariae TaxID=454162 RepID=A0ABT4LJN5_9PROT|nr:RNA-binding protein [Kiloniella laminariae]MCZ4281314.1 RNA-binding protein [Kiloniella laminariae]